MISIHAELMALESLGSNSHSSSLGIRNNEMKYLIGTQILPVMQTSVLGSTEPEQQGIKAGGAAEQLLFDL